MALRILAVAFYCVGLGAFLYAALLANLHEEESDKEKSFKRIERATNISGIFILGMLALLVVFIFI